MSYPFYVSCHCGQTWCKLWDPTIILTFQDFIEDILTQTDENSLHLGWPGSYWLKITFFLSENKLESEILRKKFNKVILKTSIQESLPLLLKYQQLIEKESGFVLEPIVRALNYVTSEVKKFVA